MSACFSSDGQLVLTALNDSTATLWSVASRECVFTLKGDDISKMFSVICAVFSPDGQQVLTASDDYTAKIWSAASGECLLTLEGHVHAVEFAAFCPDSSCAP